MGPSSTGPALLGSGKIRELEERYLPKAGQRDYASTWGHRTASTPDASPPLPDRDERAHPAH